MRRKPYTSRGIKRVPCCRCGEPSHEQWTACALGGLWFGVCLKCDVGLNRAALTYILGAKKAAPYLDKYARKVL